MKQNQKINYQRVLEQELEEISKQKAVPRLLLHSCCAPCSSYVLEYLSEYMEMCIRDRNHGARNLTEIQ